MLSVIIYYISLYEIPIEMIEIGAQNALPPPLYIRNFEYVVTLAEANPSGRGAV